MSSINDPSHVMILKEIAELLNEETELEQMLQLALERFLAGTEFEAGWIFFIEENRHQLIAYEQLPPALLERDCQFMKAGGCWCVNRYKKGELKKASNIIECKRIENATIRQSEKTNGLTHHATVPLQSGHERFGLLNVATPGRTEFSQHELALLESVAFQIGSAIKRIQLTKREQDMALMQERNRLARDLHDSVNQLLFSMTLTARGGAEMSENQETKETFSSLQSLAQEALNEMRALIWQLRPRGMEAGLSEAIKGFGDMLGIHVTVTVRGVVSLPSRVEEAIFRIAQEALTNCKRHAGTDQFFVTLQAGQKEIHLLLEDRGRGFYPQHASTVPSVGLASMMERTRLLGGRCDIDSEPDRGTKISITIPF